MDIRNRIDDVVTLRCHVCQEYLSLKIKKQCWQKELYKIAKNAIDNNLIYAASYVSAYEKMRDYGIDNYRIEDMDVTIISAIVCNNLTLVYKSNDKTISAIKSLRNDRNIADHSGKNEEPEELYLRGLMNLQDLKDFVRTVDKYETRIDDGTRQQFRQHHIQSIDNLMSILDDERILLVQYKKERKQNIIKILDSKDPSRTWFDIVNLYLCKSRIYGDFNESDIFAIEAADAGVEQAYSSAAMYYEKTKNRNLEERYLSLIFKNEELRPQHPRQMMRLADIYFHKKKIEDGQKIIDTLIKDGINIRKSTDGTSCSWFSNTTREALYTINIPLETNIRKNGLAVGGVTGIKKIRIGYKHNTNDADST